MRIHARLDMRPDMHEVIIERPRRAHTARYPRTTVRNRTAVRHGDDDPPTRERMGGIYRDKSLNENLAPLARFLRSNVGRPWSKVRSEMSRVLNPKSAVQKHVLDHLRDYVAERAWFEEGRLVLADRYGRPFVPSHRWHADFFVHPRTGLLCERPPSPRPPTDVRELSPTRQHRRIRGHWYEVTLAALPLPVDPALRDAVTRTKPSRYGGWYEPADVYAMRDVWSTGRYATALRQLSKREIRALL